MNESDDFFISFKEQVKKDIEEFLELNSEHFDLSIWYSKLRRGGTNWKQLPHVTWTYIVTNPKTDVLLANYGGWMLVYGGNWGDFHNHIMKELGEYKDYREEKVLELQRTSTTLVKEFELTNRSREVLTGYSTVPLVGVKEGE